MPVIEVEGLRKEYRRWRGDPVVALDGLDLSVPEGGVHGFLGPNASGKTTTIRCLLGLARPTAGSVRLLGADATRDLHTVIDRVGAIVEEPKFFEGFTGRRNLELFAGLRGVGGAQVDGVLDAVGLADRADDRYGGYSLGMRQRLAVAGALLKDPEVVVLDEPANGLDPAGIKEVRDLLLRLGESGTTVFVSSHQLNEIQVTCDTVTILSEGRCLAAGPVDDVLATGGAAAVVVTIEDAEGAAARLREAGYEAMVVSRDEVRVTLGERPPEDVTRALAETGRYLRGLRTERASLEDVFLRLTGEPRDL